MVCHWDLIRRAYSPPTHPPRAEILAVCWQSQQDLTKLEISLGAALAFLQLWELRQTTKAVLSEGGVSAEEMVAELEVWVAEGNVVYTGLR